MVDFHKIAFEEFAKAYAEGKASDSEYVRQQAYDRYERELQEESKSTLARYDF